jgi:hypothetical protein
VAAACSAADRVELVGLAGAHQHQARGGFALRRQDVQGLALGAGEAARGDRLAERAVVLGALENDARNRALGRNSGAGRDEFDIHR